MTPDVTCGTVYLVGAGPGAAGLLTVRAAELLAGAQVVAYDELVSPEIMALIPPAAERLAVGRRAGHHASPEIHPLILERALAGQNVVRLKAGDPLVFGRGGEEAAALRAHQIPYEIVPGITAALGAAAYSGIPLTHRRLASVLTFVTGHPAAAGARDVDWDAVGRIGGTVVLYMAVRDLEAKMARLVAAGRDARTPAAIVWAATTPRQRVAIGTLATLAQVAAARGGRPGDPAIVVVGEVAGLHGELTWWHPLPLEGRTVLVARTRSSRSKFTGPLEAAGARVVEAPIVTTGLVEDSSELDRAIAAHGEHDGIAFTSPAAVAAWLQRLFEQEVDLRSVPLVPLWALHPAAGPALEKAGLRPEGVIGEYGAAPPASWAPRIAGKRLQVLGCQGESDAVLADLAALGAWVEPVASYRRELSWPAPVVVPDLIVASSSAGARQILARPEYQGIPVAAIGPQTAEAARLGGAAVYVAASGDARALIALAIELLSSHETSHPRSLGSAGLPGTPSG